MPDTPVGTNSPDYPLTSADLGADIYCKVTATNASGTANADSNTVGPVTAVVVSAPALTNLWCWLKADAGVYSDAGTTPATNGGTVARWGDSHTGARHFNQTDSAMRPLWITNAINTTLPVIRFVATPGVSTTMPHFVGPDASALTAGEIFLVVKKAGADPGDGTEANLWTFGTAGIDDLYPYSDGKIYDGWGSSNRFDCGDPTPALNVWRLYNVVSTSSEWTNYIDGVQQFTDPGTGGTSFQTAPVLGATVSHDAGFSGDVAEMIMYSAKLSAPDKATTKAYIATKYGLSIA